MPSKASRGTEKNKDLQETEDPLQAVVLSDSFETQFTPFTLERPRCLLPLANTPLIEYTLEYLSSNGIEEVFVYCGAHTDQIEAYLISSKWTKPHAPFRLHILRSTSRSIGDAMRDLDKRAVLANDFIVVYGDVVANVPLGPALSAHRTRRVSDKNAIMTMVLRQASTHHRTKANDMLATFVLNPSERRCLQYQQLTKETGDLQLDPDSFADDSEIRADLIDCGIDICTPDVLALWSDNFDYEKPRAGFLHSVLKDYELNGKKVYTHIVDDGYAARVRNLQAYASVSQDVLAGWSWPFTPGTNWSQVIASGQNRQTNPQQEKTTHVSRTAQLDGNVSIGAGTSVGSETVIQDSVIGRECSVGRNCVIRQACLWDNITVHDNTELSDVIVASDATIGPGCRVLEGALVSYGANIPAKTVLGKRKRAVRASQKAEGAQIDGYDLLPPNNEDREVSLGLSEAFYNLHVGSQESISTLETDYSEDEDDIRQHRPSVASQGSEESHHDPRAEGFVAVNAASINDSLQHGHDVSTIQLELQSQRMAQNASEHQVRQAVAHGLCRFLAESRKTRDEIKAIIANLRPLFERVVFDSKEKKKDDQIDLLLLCQSDLVTRGGGTSIFGHICNGLYLIDDWDQEGVFQAETFEQWFEDKRSQKTGELNDLRNSLQGFMNVITAESEDEDEDDETSGSED